MTNLLFILSMMIPTGSSRAPQSIEGKDQKLSAEKPLNIRIPSRPAEVGMTKDQLVQAWGKPGHILKTANINSDPVTDYFYDGEPCQWASHSCIVQFEKGKVARVFDVKQDYFKDIEE